jgi:FkbM family methyltransferase
MECYFSCGSHLNKYNLNKNCLDKQLYEIKLISLDDYFNNTSVDYIKIDVEGAELDVLNGASNLIN